jgi:hypothetical protein
MKENVGGSQVTDRVCDLLKEGYRGDPGEANPSLVCPAKLSFANRRKSGCGNCQETT